MTHFEFTDARVSQAKLNSGMICWQGADKCCTVQHCGGGGGAQTPGASLGRGTAWTWHYVHSGNLRHSEGPEAERRPQAAREPGRVRGQDAAAAPPRRALPAPEPSGRGTSRAARVSGEGRSLGTKGECVKGRGLLRGTHTPGPRLAGSAHLAARGARRLEWGGPCAPGSWRMPHLRLPAVREVRPAAVLHRLWKSSSA